MGPGRQGEPGDGVYGQSLGRKFSVCLGKYITVFQAEIYAILVCAYETQRMLGQRNVLVFALTVRGL